MMNIPMFLKPKKDVVYLYDYFTLRQTLEKMEVHRYSAMPIVNKEGRYVGTITEGDLLYAIKNIYNLDLKLAENVPLSAIPRYKDNMPVRIDAKIEDLAEILIDQNFIPVLDDRGLFIGIITRKAVLTEIFDKKEVTHWAHL